MPNIFDFSNCLGEIYSIKVYPVGWVNPVTVEYATAKAHKYDTQLSVVWRVKGTTHTFTIYEQKLNILSKGDYKKHFEEALTNFRLDYLRWFKEDEFRDAGWKYEYQEQYGQLILPEGDKDRRYMSEK